MLPFSLRTRVPEQGRGVQGVPGGEVAKESACQCRRCKRLGFDPWVRKIPWRSPWPPTPVFLPGESHGWRSQAGYSPWGCKESYTTVDTHTPVRQLTLHFFTRSAKPAVLHLLPTLSTPQPTLWPARVNCLLCPPPPESYLEISSMLRAQLGKKLRGVWDVTLQNLLQPAEGRGGREEG